MNVSPVVSTVAVQGLNPATTDETFERFVCDVMKTYVDRRKEDILVTLVHPAGQQNTSQEILT